MLHARIICGPLLRTVKAATRLDCSFGAYFVILVGEAWKSALASLVLFVFLEDDQKQEAASSSNRGGFYFVVVPGFAEPGRPNQTYTTHTGNSFRPSSFVMMGEAQLLQLLYFFYFLLCFERVLTHLM